jgi:hypothetical protein
MWSSQAGHSLPALLLTAACTSAPETETGDSASLETGDPLVPSELPVFEEVGSEALDFGSTWCGLAFDGEQLVISSETGGDIWVAPHDLDGTQVSAETQVATQADAGSQIADHVHLFEDEHHFISFSVAGEGQGGDLFLLKLDTDLERQGLVQLLDDDPPTNDMMMVSDGQTLSVGVLEPAVGHHVVVVDTELQILDEMDIGGGEAMHANGAGAIYVDGRYHLLAPDTLAPGLNHRFMHLEFDSDWTLLDAQNVHTGADGELGMVSALSYLPDHELFVAHYSDGMSDAGGDITRLVFDTDWELLDQQVAMEGVFTRPKSMVVDDRFFLCADGAGSVQLSLFDLLD